MPKLIISAAHTSLSPGAVHNDLREFDLTKKILQKTLPHLDKAKIEYKAVPIDMPLLERIKWINKTGYSEKDGDIFLEIHINDGGNRGLEGWFSGKDMPENNSKKFAKHIVDKMSETSKHKNLGVKSEYDHDLGSLLVLNQTEQISTAVEILFIDNEEDIKILKDEEKLDELAKHLVDAIKSWVDNPPKLSNPDPAQKKKDPSLPFGGVPMPDTSKNKFANPRKFGGSSFGGGLGGSSFGGGAFGGGKDPLDPTGSNSNSSGGNNSMMDRDDRKKMIEKAYKKYLGSEAKQSDMTYYLNTGISEEELLKKIIKSKDHEDLVKNAKEVEDLRTKSTKNENEMLKYKNKSEDLEKMLQNLNNLLAHKNAQIQQMQQELIQRGLVRQGEYYDPNRVNPPSQDNAPYQQS